MEATSTWTQDSYDDFVNGTLDKITIDNYGGDAQLRLNFSQEEEDGWVEKMPPIKPSRRFGHGFSPINGTDKVLLFGGWDTISFPSIVFNDTWVYDYSEDSWTNMFPTGENPPPSAYALMTPIYDTDKVFLVATTTSSMNPHRTWVYDLSDNNWTRKSDDVNAYAMTNRGGMASVFGTDKIIHVGEISPNYMTWEYNVSNDTWTNKTPINPLNSPTPRHDTAMASIHGTDKILLFGGQKYGAGLSQLNDTWIYDLSDNTWTQKWPFSTPPGREGHAMTTIYGYDKVLLYGGYNQSSYYQNDTIIYDLSKNTWTRMFPQNDPRTRGYHSMASINGTATIVLFGGFTGSLIADDTWIYGCSLYRENGTLISSAYDLGSNTSLKTINWNANISGNTSIKFQLRSAATESGLLSMDFVGNDGSTATYYNITNSTIWSGHHGDRWIQYKAYFYTDNDLKTPILNNVTIVYNKWPNTMLLSPNNMSKLNNNKPNFVWNFTDPDSVDQDAFQIIFDNDPDLTSIDFDTGMINSTNRFWQCPIGTNFTEFPDGTWYWKARTKDCDGDWGLYAETWSFTIDSIPPTSEVEYPVDDQIYNQLKTIKGIAYDPQPSTGLSDIKIQIKRIHDNHSWTGSKWAIENKWLLANGLDNWTYDSSLVTWSSEVYYCVYSKGTDNIFNREKVSKIVHFTFDFNNPTTAIDYPLHESWLNHLDAIRGTAEDTGGAEIKSVEIYISPNTVKKSNWNGSAWISRNKVIWLETSGTTTWTYDTSTIPWVSGGQYITRARVGDFANNSGILSTPVEFGIDFDKPTSEIIYPVNNSFLNSLDTISGSAKEYGGSGITNVDICITRDIDNKSWHGTNWYLGEYWLTPTGTYLWSFDSNNITWTNDLYYTIRSRATDLAGNIQEPYSVNTFMYDASPPYTSILINDGDKYTNITTVTLSLEAVDSGSGLDTVELSTDNAYWVPEDSFNTTKQYELPGSDGEKTVYLRVADRAGNIAESIFDTIILDTTPPEYLTIAINNDNKYTNNRQALLELNASDSLSGIKDVSYFIGDDWTPWEPFKLERSISLPSGEGKKNVVYRVRDNAGNIAQVSSSIVLDTMTPFSLMISIIESTSEQDPTSITLKLTAFDNTSGVAQMTFSLNGENWSAWEVFSTTKIYVVLWDGDPNTLYFRVNDRAGNIAEPVSVEIPTNEGSLPTKAKTSSTLDLWNILFIIIILIIILALAVFILKRKKTEKQEKRQEPTTQDAITVKPSEPFSSIPIKPGGELTVDNQTEQLPVRTIITSGAAETEMPVPELPATTTAGTVPGQTPEPQQMPESPEKPQLPPAQTQDQPLQPQPNETSTGIVSQPSPATPEQPQPQAVQKKLDENEST